MNFTNLWLFVLILVPIFIPMIFIPFWTRKTDSFGVSIPEEVYQHPQIKKMRQKYAWMNVLLALLTSALFLALAYGHDEKYISLVFPFIIFGYIFTHLAVYLFFHKQMKAIKNNHPDWTNKEQRVIINTGFRSQKLVYSNYWFIIPYIISIFTTIITLTNYQIIPERIPMHFSFSGEVNRWADKSYRSILLTPIIQLFMTSLFLFINIMISKAKQQVSAANPEESIRQNVIFRKRWSLLMLILGTSMIILLMLQQLSLVYPINQQLLMGVHMVFVISVCIAAIILSITTGQGGSRIRRIKSDENSEIINRDDDRYWKLGIFYFNKNDPAIFLERRFGIGWTTNWAHPLSWIIILIILLVAVGLPKLLR